MNLLTNAIEAIQVGVEDYKKGSHPRLLAAVRNIYAGLLLEVVPKLASGRIEGRQVLSH